MKPVPSSRCRHSRPVGSLLLSAWVGCLLARPGAAQDLTQTFPLQAGWNAIWLQVEPVQTATDRVFADAPIESVWTYGERLTAVDFIRDTTEPVWNREQWLMFLPPNRPGAFQNNLFHVQAGRAYLIKARRSFELVVTGRPLFRPLAWAPDAYNLRGLPVDPTGPPTFRNFFRHSRAHFAGNRLQPIYRLNPSGQWSRVAPDDPIVADHAYWIHTTGGSTYQGPLEVTGVGGEGLDFGAVLNEATLRLHNATPSLRSVFVRDLGGPEPSRLAAYHFDPQRGGEWNILPDPLHLTAPGRGEVRLRLAVRRQQFSGDRHETLLEITDNAGSRWVLPVSAHRATVSAPGARRGLAGTGGAVPHAGLWLGTASINAVGEAHSAHPSQPTPTRSEFNLRLLLHVDRAGTARLLKEVFQMWEDGTYTNNAAGRRMVDQPGRFVLLTDDRLIPQFQGAALRNGVPVGRRLSTVGFDFPADPAENALVLAGTFGGSGTLSGTINIPADFPTNPFKHKYHPDHNNLDATYQLFREEAYAFTRSFSLQFSPTNTTGTASPSYGDDLWGGTYTETISGIHQQDIVASGSFRLRRVAATDTLNQ